MPGQLTDLEQLLLLATLRQPAEAYGAALQEDMEQNASRHVSLGTIHLTMARLEDRGLAESRLGEPTGGRGGKAKRLYAVTEEGRRELARARQILERMWAGVPQEAR